MSLKFSLAAAFLALSLTPALADASSCVEPVAPAPIDGATATDPQLIAASHDANVYMKASDDYQSCLNADLKNEAIAAKNAKEPKPLDPAIIKAINDRITGNQRMKEKIGGEFHGALVTYCQRKDSNPANCKSVQPQ